jgi:hypothetical protein
MYDHDLNKRVMESLIKCGALTVRPQAFPGFIRIYELLLENSERAAQAGFWRGSSTVRRQRRFRLVAPPVCPPCPIFPNIPPRKHGDGKRNHRALSHGSPMDEYRTAPDVPTPVPSASHERLQQPGGPRLHDEQRVTWPRGIRHENMSTRNQSLLPM